MFACMAACAWPHVCMHGRMRMAACLHAWLHGRMVTCMAAWLREWLYGRMSANTIIANFAWPHAHGRMLACMAAWPHGCMHGCMAAWLHAWLHGRMRPWRMRPCVQTCGHAHAAMRANMRPCTCGHAKFAMIVYGLTHQYRFDYSSHTSDDSSAPFRLPKKIPLSLFGKFGGKFHPCSFECNSERPVVR